MKDPPDACVSEASPTGGDGRNGLPLKVLPLRAQLPLREPSQVNPGPRRNRVPRLLLTASVLFLTAIVAATAKSSASQHNLRQQDEAAVAPEFMRELQAQQDPKCELECCRSFESDICSSESSWVDALPFALQIILIAVLLSLSALFSGLTLGLMSLDKTGLEIVMGGDDERAAQHAKVIYPIREDGNLLLCTLLLGNVAVNSMLSILLAEYAGGITGFLVSTFAIVIFGEILPQAMCSRYALRIGSATVPLVKIIRFALYVIAKPLAWCLDKSLGRELVSTYSATEMLKLLQIHAQENVLDPETAGAMAGALTYKNITVKEAMTPLERTFMLNVDEKLSFDTIATIFRTGYSRIPVYEISPNNVIGLLFVKDLIFIDPEDATPLRSFVQIFGRGVHVVWPDDKLGDILSELKRGRSHLALVRDVNNEDDEKDPFYEMKGIITLEDIIEKIIGDTIVDETDAFVDSNQSVRVDRVENFEWARLRMLDSKIVDEHLSHHEVQAVTAHLRVNYPNAVELLTDTQLFRLIATTPVCNLPTATHELGQQLPTDLIYEKGLASQTCTLILGGKVSVMVGSENFRSDMSSWSLLAISALSDPSYSPDFTAFVSDGPCRCLQITYDAFSNAVDASTLERNTAPGTVMAAGAVNASANVPGAAIVGGGVAPPAAASQRNLAVLASQSSIASVDAKHVKSVTGDELEASHPVTRRQKLLRAFALNRDDDHNTKDSNKKQQQHGDDVSNSKRMSHTAVRFQEGGLLQTVANVDPEESAALHEASQRASRTFKPSQEETSGHVHVQEEDGQHEDQTSETTADSRKSSSDSSKDDR